MRIPLCAAVTFCSISMLSLAQSPAKRPLTHADYDIWNTVSGMTLSPDGRFVAYTVGQTKGDVTFTVKNVASGAEYKFTRGGASAEGAPEGKGDPDEEGEDQFRGGGTFGGMGGATITGSPTFTPDGKYLYFVQTPTRVERDKATAEKKEAPKPAVAVLDLGTGKIKERITGIRSFSITGKGAGLLVMTREPKSAGKETAPMPKKAGAKAEEEDDQAPKQPEAKKEETPAAGRSGNDLVIRNLEDGKEYVFSEVQEQSITRDYSQIVYAVSSKKTENNGVYVADLFAPEKAQAIIKGVGRYYRLVWDDKQSQLAFFFDENLTPAATPPANPTAPAGGAPPGRGIGGGGGRRGGGGAQAPTTPNSPAAPTNKPKVYLWERAAKGKTVSPASLVLGPETAGLKKGWQIVDRGGLSFSADGLKLNISAAPEPEKSPEPKKQAAPAAGPAEPKVELDLWHWKDEVLQPMQKIRGVNRNRSFPTVYFIDSKKLVHLGDEDLTVRSAEFGDWAVASSDKKYRHQTWESPTPADYALVNLRTGESKPLLTAAKSSLSASPKGNYVAGFDGKHWFTISVPDGKKTILTAKLKPKFFNEDFDSPMTPPPYPQLGWSSDEKYFFVSDRHDIWKLAPDGTEAVNVTQVGGQLGLRFRLARVEKPEDDDGVERERGLDTKHPWLLAAENLVTHDTGFYRLEPGQAPKLLLMGARGYGMPTKAKKADTMVMTVSTFTDYPDYYATSTNFQEIKRLTDANPRRKEFNWATAELVKYTSTDGARLSGILVKPEDFDPAKKYPMIVYIYERLSNGIYNYHSPIVSRGQVVNPIWYASNGYLVFMPDIAYTIGHPGQSAMHCVLPAIQAVVDKGYVDENAIGINGQSWGGYQIAYMVTQTNRFKAAVAGAAVTNMVSAYNGIRWGSGMARQFQYERTQSRIGQTLWEAPMKYIENSPVFWADRVTTPLMMINNDADDAVPWYQGIEFYLSLRRLDKEVYMLNYNNEPHNLAKQVNARDFALRMHQFFEHHLKGKPMPEWMAKGVPFAERDKEKEQWKKLFGPQEPEKKAEAKGAESP